MSDESKTKGKFVGVCDLFTDFCACNNDSLLVDSLMMNDKELADRIVALGVVTKRYWIGDQYRDSYTLHAPSNIHLEHYFLGSILLGGASNCVRDWRVAGALMEKWARDDVHEIDFGKEGNRYYANLSHAPEREWVRASFVYDESFPRAIIEACVEAMSDDSVQV